MLVDLEERVVRRLPCFGRCLKSPLTQQARESSAALAGDVLSGRTAISLTRVFPEKGYSTHGVLFHCQCLFYGVSSPLTGNPKGNVGPACSSDRSGSDQTTLAPGDPLMEWEFTNESPGRFFPSDEKTWMFRCRGCPLRRPWPWYYLPASRRPLNSVVAIPTKQNKPVSSILYHPVHLFPSHADSYAETTSWLSKPIKPLRRSHRICENEDPTRRAQQVLGFAPIPSRPTAASATLTSPLGSWP